MSDTTETENNPNKNDEELLIIDVDGFEGPLDLLLTLARSQKVDLTKISILELAQQYLLFVSEARKYRLELAADYLVMASWLAFLKSKLLLPPEEKDEDGPTGEELAALLTFRLQKLNAMREAAAKIMNRKRLGRDVFARGMPQNVRVIKTPEFQAETYELLKAYALQRQRKSVVSVKLGGRTVWSIKRARERLDQLLGTTAEWFPMDRFLSEFEENSELSRTATASTFGASLELAREGDIEIKQSQAFAPIYVRRKTDTEE
ncbi:MAG: segregation and condensation protein A [Methyloligellaceae bacterium]